MKNLRKTLLLVLAVVMANADMVVADDAEVSVRKIESEQKAAVIRVTNLSSDESAVLRIKDQQGHVLHREVVDQSEVYIKKYDFSQLPSGEYVAELETKEGVVAETFALESGKAHPLYFKPAVQVEPGLVKVAFINRIDTPVSIKLYNEKGQVLYHEKVASEEKYSKGLNISQLEAGQYSLAILGEDYVYSESIELP